MWLAVLFDGIYGSDMVFNSAGNGTTTIPSAVAVALFAFIGTVAVARRAFARRDLD
jgi:multisubunit Na+/H+ antiporter MnhF subunit